VAKQTQRPFRVYAGQGRVQAVGTAFTVFIRDNQAVDVAVSEGIVALAVLDRLKQKSTGPGAAVNEKTSLESAASETLAPALQNEQNTAVQSPPRAYHLAVPVNKLGRLAAGQETTLQVSPLAQEAGQNTRLEVKQVSEEELARRGAWRQGLLIFNGDSLEHAVKEVSRYTTLSINIVDTELNKVRIGGRFSVNSTRDFFSALEANFGLRVTRLDYSRVEISAIKKI